MKQTAKSPSGALGWIVAAIMSLVAIGQCSSKEPASAVESASSPKFVQARSLNCRAEPSQDANVLRSFRRNETVAVAEETAGWSRIEGSPDCWASAAFLSTSPAAEPSPEPVAGLLTNYAADPKPAPQPRRRAAIRESYSESAYYPNCSAARAAGAAPVMAGEPGYSRRLDRDGDGVGCE